MSYAAAWAASLIVLVTLGAACVKIPDETAATFAPARPDEPSRYERRADAPSPDGFVPADGGGETVGKVTITVRSVPSRSSATSDAGAPSPTDGGVS